MANLKALNEQWREFTTEKAQARELILDEVTQNNDKIEVLRLRNAELNAYIHSEFKQEWDRKKFELQEARDRAVMDELAKGRSAQAILREMGSRNTVWIYKLRARLVAEGRLPEGQNENSAPIPKEKLTAKQILDAQMDASEYEHIKWHPGTGPELTGWSISDDVQLVKRERRGGRWFIAGPTNEFLKGDRGFYDLTGDEAITEAANKLMDLMEDDAQQAS